jgi:hypothetical protein
MTRAVLIAFALVLVLVVVYIEHKHACRMTGVVHLEEFPPFFPELTRSPGDPGRFDGPLEPMPLDGLPKRWLIPDREITWRQTTGDYFGAEGPTLGSSKPMYSLTEPDHDPRSQ